MTAIRQNSSKNFAKNFRKFLATFALTLTPLPTLAQEVVDCDWRASARNIAEPWETNTRTFANGKTRIAVLDTLEPAAASFHLLILSPPYAELGEPQCKVVSFDGGMGFHHMTLDGMHAGYDPTAGLVFDIPVEIWISDLNILVRSLHITLNQATGAISATQ